MQHFAQDLHSFIHVWVIMVAATSTFVTRFI